jgi:hypothetical protein
VWDDLVLVYLKEKFENKKLNTSDSKHNIPTYIIPEPLSQPFIYLMLHKYTNKQTKTNLTIFSTTFL